MTVEAVLDLHGPNATLPTQVAAVYLGISIIYAFTLLHLRKRSAKLDSMIVLESTAGVVSALPGVAASRTLRLGQLPKLLPIIIQVAVPGPA